MSKIVYEIECEYDETAVHGSFASGDDATDRELEESILQRCRQGDVWAWCSVRVKAIAPDGTEAYSDWLGGCSYQNEADYRENSGYFIDQCAEARENLLKFEESHAPSIHTLKCKNGRIRVSTMHNTGVKLIAWDHALDAPANHAAAAKQLASELGWTGRWVASSLVEGRCVFVKAV